MKMKTTALLISTMALSFVASAQPKKTEASSTTQVSESEMPKKKTSTPSALYLSNGIFDAYYGSGFLAPVQGSELALNFSQSLIKIGNNYGTSNIDTSIGYLNVAHAFNSSFFVSANLGFMQSTGLSTSSSSGRKYHSKSNGLLDPVITVGGRVYSESLTLIMALSAKVGSGDTESKDFSDTNTEGNAKNGGSSVTPSLTVHTNSTDVVVGGTISYAFMSERTTKDTDTGGRTQISKSTGANAQNASLFFESTRKKLSFGGSLDYMKIEPNKIKEEDGREYTGNSSAFTTATAFMGIELNEQLKLIPSLSLGRITEGLGDATTKDLYSAGVVGKTTF